MSRLDPNGEYGCRRNLKTLQCEAFLERQAEAVGQIEQGIRELTQLEKDMKAGKLTAADRGIQARIDKYGGKGRGEDLGSVAQLIQRANQMANVLNNLDI
jgi:hypothetical protein